MKQRYRLKIRLVKTRYWTPKKLDSAIKYLSRIIERNYIRNSILFISEKALRVLTGDIYDESRISTSLLDILFTRIHKFVWCRIFRNYVRENILNTICSVRDEDLAKHLHFTVARCCVKSVLSCLKPTSGCGIDASYLPYMYVTDLEDRYVQVVNNLWSRYCNKLLAIVVVDSDLSLVERKGSIILTSRPTYVKNVINVGFLTYIISKSFLRKFFIKTMTVTYYVGKINDSRTFFILSKFLRRYMYNRYGMTLLEQVMCFEAVDYTGITWNMLLQTVNYPMAFVKISKG